MSLTLQTRLPPDHTAMKNTREELRRRFVRVNALIALLPFVFEYP